MSRRLSAVLAALVFAAVSLAAASPAAASTSGGFVAAINGARAQKGRAPLAHRGDLALIAQRHAQRMARSNSLHHNPGLTRQVSNWRAVGENVGVGGNVSTLHRAFMNSSAHRANILDRDYTEVGVGVAVDSRGVLWVAEVFRQPARATAPPRTVAAAKTPAPAVHKRLPLRRRVVTRPETAGSTRPASTWASRLQTAGTR